MTVDPLVVYKQKAVRVLFPSLWQQEATVGVPTPQLTNHSLFHQHLMSFTSAVSHAVHTERRFKAFTVAFIVAGVALKDAVSQGSSTGMPNVLSCRSER